MLSALTGDECRRLLAAHRLGRVAVTMPSGQPVIRPVNYVFDPVSQCVVFRSRSGSKQYALSHASRASFEVDDGAGGPAGAWSVIVSGRLEVVSRADEIERLERLGLETWGAEAGMRWIRIHANAISGRRFS